jgi:hypothetical protein
MAWLDPAECGLRWLLCRDPPLPTPSARGRPRGCPQRVGWGDGSASRAHARVRREIGGLNRCLTRAGCDHHMKTGATVAAFARPVRLRPVDRRSTPCPRASPIAPRTSSLAVQTQRRKLRRTRPERSAWPEPEPTSSGPWQLREPMLPDDRAEQKPHPGHDPIAVADARSALDEVQLETPHLVGRRCIGGTLQPGGEPLAARNVAALSVRVELACSHVLDHGPFSGSTGFKKIYAMCSHWLETHNIVGRHRWIGAYPSWRLQVWPPSSPRAPSLRSHLLPYCSCVGYL